jgi:hypothetical protein
VRKAMLLTKLTSAVVLFVTACVLAGGVFPHAGRLRSVHGALSLRCRQL